MIPIILIIGGVYFFMQNSNADTGETTSNSASKHDYNIYDSLFKFYGNQFGVDWLMLKRLSFVESTLGLNKSVAEGLRNPSNINGSASTDGLSWGIMQITITTARDYDKTAGAVKLNNPEYSIKIAAQHLSKIKKLFSSERDIVMSYNHGQGNQQKFVKAEKSGTLLSTQYLGARYEYDRYLIAKKMF